MSVITIEKKILEKNDLIAANNRDFFNEKKIFVINILSSPGSGKTSLIERSLARWGKKIKFGIIEGDVQTDLDAQRLDVFKVPVVQIVTNGACHLDANLVRDAYSSIEKEEIELLIIENVGNLVCPAGFDLGEHIKVVVTSITEGDDKPLKYPSVFRNSSVLIINKTDLLPHVNSSLAKLKKNALSINPSLKIFETSCVTDDGIDKWCKWLKTQINKNESSTFY
ncbi:MAG: hydrogenase nickel incorporation protein HypB [Ignavibacteria bacterium]|nr:hydrogenase nickel incorporation protein HypB [Ignavibacteria bacterium]